MKFFNNLKQRIINKYWYINFKHVILFLLLLYIVWLVRVFYISIVEVDRMYSDSYDKRVDEKWMIQELIEKKKMQNEDEYQYKISIENITNKKK